MYRVVIVDDEDVIVEGLSRVVNWKAHGCHVAGTAFDARSGREVICRVRPHILFTDIKMPGEDGLTMLAGLKGEFPQMQIVVLTGHRDFDYARRALELGVSRFLLKPSKMEELEEALRHVAATLNTLPPLPEEDATAEEPADNTANSFLVRQAQAYIAQHHAEKLTLKDVADSCYVSQWHLSKLMGRHLGQTFYDLLNGVRVEKAKQLLEDPSLRISEIAAMVGYTDTAHFSRIFKKAVGLSAGDYRNQHCGPGKT